MGMSTGEYLYQATPIVTTQKKTPSGTIDAQDINDVTGKPLTQKMTLNDSAVRNFAGKTSGTISYNDCRNRSMFITSPWYDFLSHQFTGADQDGNSSLARFGLTYSGTNIYANVYNQSSTQHTWKIAQNINTADFQFWMDCYGQNGYNYSNDDSRASRSMSNSNIAEQTWYNFDSSTSSRRVGVYTSAYGDDDDGDDGDNWGQAYYYTYIRLVIRQKSTGILFLDISDFWVEASIYCGGDGGNDRKPGIPAY